MNIMTGDFQVLLKNINMELLILFECSEQSTKLKHQM